MTTIRHTPRRHPDCGLAKIFGSSYERDDEENSMFGDDREK